MVALNNRSTFKVVSNSNSGTEECEPQPRWIPPSVLDQSFTSLYAQSTINNKSTRLVANVFDDSFEYTFPEDSVRAVSNPLSSRSKGIIATPKPNNPNPPVSSSSSDSHMLDFGDLFSSMVPAALRQQMNRNKSFSPAASKSRQDSSFTGRPTADESNGSSGASDRELSVPSSPPKPQQNGTLRSTRLQHLSAEDLEPVLQYIDEAIRKGITNNEFLTKVSVAASSLVH